MRIRFQTSALVPPPYAYAIELHIEIKENKLKYDFDLTYLDRDQISEQEILEEGFSIDDQFAFKGAFENVWLDELDGLLKKTEETYPIELEEDQEYWDILIKEPGFYPKNYPQWSDFLQSFHQAVLEQNNIERPLSIEIKRIEGSHSSTFQFTARFAKREFSVVKNGSHKKILDWNNLNVFVKDIYSGDLNYEKAESEQPRNTGIYINYGDDLWFELGLNWLTKPSKITKWIENL